MQSKKFSLLESVVKKPYNRVGNLNPNWKGGKISINCKTCNKIFFVNQYRIKNGEAKFCSKKCLNEGKKKIKGKNASNWKGGGIKKNCIICGKIFYIKKSEDGKRGKFCSRECHYKWKSKNKRGKNNHAWLGGITPERQAFYKSKEWKIACKKVWARDKSTCQRCGITKKEYNNFFDIHHILSFKNKIFRADINNLVLLCDSCHAFVHSKKNINKEFIDKGQSKIFSLFEACCNTIIGYFISLLGQLLIFPIFNIYVDIKTNLYIGAGFTVISIARSYILRRVFNGIKR